MKTRAPSVAKRLAVARPIPVVPPVTTAIFPSSLRTTICLLAVGFSLALGLATPSFDAAPAPENSIAARYYFRYRTQDFYNRARPKSYRLRMASVAADPASAPGDVHLNSVDVESTQIAARYYFRNRTREFYQRAQPKGRRLFA